MKIERGMRVVLTAYDNECAPDASAKGRVVRVDKDGTTLVKWDNPKTHGGSVYREAFVYTKHLIPEPTGEF